MLGQSGNTVTAAAALANCHLPDGLIADNELEITAIRAQGAGGQHVNKTSSAIHLRFDIRASGLHGRPDACLERAPLVLKRRKNLRRRFAADLNRHWIDGREYAVNFIRIFMVRTATLSVAAAWHAICIMMGCS